MKVTHWAAALGVGLAILGTPVYAQYPLYGQPAATGPQYAQQPHIAPPLHTPQPTRPAHPSAPADAPISGQVIIQPPSHPNAANFGPPANVPGLPARPPLGRFPGEVSTLRQRSGPGPANRRPLPPVAPPRVEPDQAAATNPPTVEASPMQVGPAQSAPKIEQQGPTFYHHPKLLRQRPNLRGFGAHIGAGITFNHGEPKHGEPKGKDEFGFAAGGLEACCEPPPRSAWYGSVDGLLLTRDNENEVWFSYDTANIASQIIGSLDARMGWRFGVDARIGHYIDDGRHSVEMAYWGITSGVEEANAFGAAMVGTLDSSLVFDSLMYDPGAGAVTVASLFNTAERHQLVRSYRAHNAEINAWRHCVDTSCGKDAWATARLSWMAGFRYMNYSEGFHYAADPFDTTFGNQSQSELRYDTSINNHLVGFQVGGMGEFCLNDRWQFNTTVKAGVMGNRMEMSSFIGSIHRSAYVDNVASPFHNDRWNVNETKNDVSLLGELDFGMRYRWTDHWNVTSGYRAIGLSGVGLATNQVPVYFANLGGVRQIDSNASLILHGFVYVGAEYNY